MSAFLVGPDHIRLMVRAAMVGDGTRWYHGEKFCALKVMDYDGAEKVAAMLAKANWASIRARYPDTVENPDDAPGDTRKFEMGLGKPHPTPTPVELLKAIHCYEYQSCEDEGWRESEAFAFCRSLERKTMRHLPGYDEAPWDWSEEVYGARTKAGGCINLSEMMGRRK